MVVPTDVPSQKLAREVANVLKEIIKAPKWAVFVKTGTQNERPPLEPDWWYIRAASVLRTVYRNGPVGVSKLRSKYGGNKRRGVRPPRFTKASGAILRKILQQLETAGLVAKVKEGVHKGRIITPAGVSMLSKAAAKVKQQ